MRQSGHRSSDVRDGQGMGGSVSSTMRHHHDSQKRVDTDSYPHNSTNANGTSTPTKTSSSSATPGIQLETIAITIHGMFDLPPQIASLNADTCTLELVLKSNVRYYRDGNRLTTLPLPTAYLPFSPADISNKHDRLCVGFAKDKMSVTLFSREVNQHAVARTTIAPDITTHPMECGKLFVHPDNITVAKDGRFLLQFPIYPEIKAVFEVFVGARARYHHSCTGYTWMTATVRGLMELRKTSFFSFSDGEVHRQKVIHRLVGTSVGRLLVSVSLPHCLDNLPETEPDCEALQVHICAAARRLLHDAYRFNVLYPGAHATKMLEYVAHTNYGLGFRDRLGRGESEYSIYNDLLSRACPEYYVRRVERIIEMYPPTSSTDSWLQGLSAGQLVAAHKGKELDLVRMVCVMLGPEPCCVGPRERMRAFALATALDPEHIHLADTCKLPDRILSVCHEDDLSDYEPEYYFDHLEKTLKTKERRPIEYNVCPVEVVKDERLYFSEALRFPVNGPEGRFRDQTLAARQRRIPLQLTPYERPLEPPPGESRSHQVNEIDILQNKYKIEFAQIIPSFADAMDAVVRQHEGLLSKCHTNLSKGNDFARFYSSHPCEPYSLLLTRLSEYTYISPSSLIACFVYMDRLLRRYPDLHLTRHNIERLVVTSLRIASKFVDLRSINNRNFAQIFRLQSSDINVIEEQLVNLMKFEFFLSPMEHYHYVLRMDFAPPTPWWLRAGANSQLSRMMSAMSLDYSSRGVGEEGSGQDGGSPRPMAPRGPGVKTPLIPIMGIPSTTAATTAKGVAAICVPQSNEASIRSLTNETRASDNGHNVPSRRTESVSERTAAANPAVGIIMPQQTVVAGGITVKSSDAKKASSGDAVPRGGGSHTALVNPKVVAKRASLTFSRKPQSRGQSTSSSANGNVSVQ